MSDLSLHILKTRQTSQKLAPKKVGEHGQDRRCVRALISLLHGAKLEIGQKFLMFLAFFFETHGTKAFALLHAVPFWYEA
jgi:hypothetical protein